MLIVDQHTLLVECNLHEGICLHLCLLYEYLYICIYVCVGKMYEENAIWKTYAAFNYDEPNKNTPQS